MSAVSFYHVWVPQSAEIEVLEILRRLGIEYSWEDQYEEED